MPRAQRSVFIGYSNTQKGYKVYNLENKTVVISKDVIFHEHHFPFHQNDDNQITQIFIPASSDQSIHFEDPFTNDAINTDELEPTIINIPYNDGHTNLTPITKTPQHDDGAIEELTDAVTEHESLPVVNEDIQVTEVLPRRSQRAAKTPTHLKDYYCHTVTNHWCGFDNYHAFATKKITKISLLNLEATRQPY